MSIFIRGFCILTLGGLLLAVAVPSAVAQQPAVQNPPNQPNPAANPNFRVTPLQLGGQQAAPAVDPNAAALAPGVGSPLTTPIVPGAATGSLSNPYMNGSGSSPNRYGSLIGPNSIPYYNPYSYPNYNPYYGYGYSDPYGGYLRGIADITNANAQYYAIIQQARIIQQAANQSALDTRRKWFDQIRYERSVMPTPEDIRIADMQAALNRSRRNVHRPKADRAGVCGLLGGLAAGVLRDRSHQFQNVVRDGNLV